MAFLDGDLGRGEFSQRDLGQKSGVGHTGMWRALNGMSMRPRTLWRIASAARVPVDLRNRAVRAAEILHNHALLDEQPAPPQSVPQDPLGRRYTHGGGWLAEQVYQLWGSRAEFEREVPVKSKTLDRYFFNGSFCPRTATVGRIAAALSGNLKQVVTADDVLNHFGGRTYEDAQQQDGARPACSICGRPIPRRLSRRGRHARRASPHPVCGDACKSIQRIIRSGVETEIGKWIVTVMAAVANVPADRIALLLQVPVEIIAGWFREWAALVEEARKAIPESKKRPWQAMARVLDVGSHALGMLVHHRVRHIDRRRPVAPQWIQEATLKTLVEKFKRTPQEILAAAQRKGTMTQFGRARGPRASIQRFHLGKNRRRPIDPDTHKAAQLILRAAWRGATRNEITHALEDANLLVVDDPMWTARQHSRSCAPCRALMAAYLHERKGKTLDDIGDLFDCTKVWAGILVKRGLSALSHPYP